MDLRRSMWFNTKMNVFVILYSFNVLWEPHELQSLILHTKSRFTKVAVAANGKWLVKNRLKSHTLALTVLYPVLLKGLKKPLQGAIHVCWLYWFLLTFCVFVLLFGTSRKWYVPTVPQKPKSTITKLQKTNQSCVSIHVLLLESFLAVHCAHYRLTCVVCEFW